MIANALDILEGLTQLHALHVLHLGLKPGNVLLDDRSHAYLSDVGVSRALWTLGARTAVTCIAGTPYYMYSLSHHCSISNTASDRIKLLP